MNKQLAIPAFISSLRIAALPLFIYLFSRTNIVGCLLLLPFCAATDFLDGCIARKLNATSTFGCYYDATTDFCFTSGTFALFTFNGYYPIWLLILISAAFAQFIITSFFSKKIYDPVGKYIGSALYIGIALTLLLPDHITFDFVQYAFVGFFSISLVSRIISLTRKRV
jgi:CDP-diacylglycerol---glycerol-3-phosphate 3-phosphatidyltransferase